MDKIFLKVNRIFYDICSQGEYIGMPMTFLYLTNDNLTNYSSRYRIDEMTEEEILRRIKRNPSKYVLVAGDDEPLQQDLIPLLEVLHNNDYRIHLKTNGMYHIPDGFDYVCISLEDEWEWNNLSIKETIGYNLLKADSVIFKCGTPQWRDIIEYYSKSGGATIKYLQPIYGDEKSRQEAIEFVLRYPKYRFSLPVTAPPAKAGGF